MAWALTHPPRRPTCPGRRLLPRLLPGVRVPPRAAPTARRAPAGPRLSCGGGQGERRLRAAGAPGGVAPGPGRATRGRVAQQLLRSSERGCPRRSMFHPAPSLLGGRQARGGAVPSPRCPAGGPANLTSPVPYPCSPLPSPRSIRALLVLLSPLGNSWSLFDHSWSFPGPQFWEHFRLFRASLGIPSLLFFPRFWAS